MSVNNHLTHHGGIKKLQKIKRFKDSLDSLGMDDWFKNPIGHAIVGAANIKWDIQDLGPSGFLQCQMHPEIGATKYTNGFGQIEYNHPDCPAANAYWHKRSGGKDPLWHKK